MIVTPKRKRVWTCFLASVRVKSVLAAFLNGSGCLYSGDRPYRDKMTKHSIPLAVFRAKFKSIVCCLRERGPM